MAFAPMPGRARRLVITRRTVWWLAGLRPSRGGRLVWMHMRLWTWRSIRPVWRRVAPWRDAWRAARVGGALRRGIKIVDWQIRQKQGGRIYPACRRFGALIPLARFLGP